MMLHAFSIFRCLLLIVISVLSLNAFANDSECKADSLGATSISNLKCQKTIAMLAEKNVSMSIKEYRLLEKSCNSDHGCIDIWAKKWTDGNRSFPLGAKVDVGGIDFTDLMAASSNPPQQENPNKYSLQPPKTPSVPSNKTTATEIRFDDIYSRRDQLRIDGLQKQLAENNEVIASRCQCSLNQSSCFNVKRFRYPELNEAIASTESKHETDMAKVCKTWREAISGTTSRSEFTLNQYLTNTAVVLNDLDLLQDNFNKISARLTNKEVEITRTQQTQEEESEQGGFNFGKFTALTSGIILGGGLELEGSQLANLVGGAALDSVDGVEGVSNLHQSVANLTQIELASLKQQKAIEAQSNRMALEKTKKPTSGYYDALDTRTTAPSTGVKTEPSAREASNSGNADSIGYPSTGYPSTGTAPKIASNAAAIAQKDVTDYGPRLTPVFVQRENVNSWPTPEDACKYAKNIAIRVATKECKEQFGGRLATESEIEKPIDANCQSYRQMEKDTIWVTKGQWKVTGNVILNCLLPKKPFANPIAPPSS